nr:MAG TPA: hypothetical protein [Caudoviricetes sp.]
MTAAGQKKAASCCNTGRSRGQIRWMYGFYSSSGHLHSTRVIGYEPGEPRRSH